MQKLLEKLYKFIFLPPVFECLVYQILPKQKQKQKPFIKHIKKQIQIFQWHTDFQFFDIFLWILEKLYIIWYIFNLFLMN